MRQVVSQGLRRLTARNARLPTLEDLIKEMDPTVYYQVLALGAIDLYHPFIHQLVNTLNSMESLNESIFSRLELISKKSPCRPEELKMKIRAYISRADLRAFYTDTMIVRSVVAAGLTAILETRKAERRLLFGREKYYPMKDKNILDRRVEVPEGHACLIGLGDVSSFTNSNVNSWALVLTIAVILSRVDCVKHLNRPLLLDLSGYQVEITALSILLWYLILTVGAPSQLPNKETYVAPGGYLGVKGNILLTIEAFAVLCDEVEVKARTLYPNVTIDTDLGGDDFATTCIGPPLEASSCMDYMRNQVELQMGRVKDFKIHVVATDQDNMQRVGVFCKKYVRATVTHFGTVALVHIQSEQKLPLFGELIVDETTSELDKKQLAMKFQKTLIHYFENYDSSEDWISTYLRMFQLFYQLPDTVTIISHHYDVDEDTLFKIDTKYVTRRVFDTIITTSEVSSESGLTALRSPIDKLLALHRRETITMTNIKLVRAGSFMFMDNVYHYESEYSSFRRTSSTNVIVLNDYNERFIDDLLPCYMKLRNLAVKLSDINFDYD